MNRLAIITATAGILALAAPLSAQGANKSRTEIPKEQRPPAGMCRIWLDGVPAGQQPAPTDCATAIRHRPPKGRVIFGSLRDTVVQKGQTRPFMGRARSIDRNADRARNRDQRLDSITEPARAQRDDEPPAGSRTTSPVRKPIDQRTAPTTKPRTDPRIERRVPTPPTRIEPDKRQRRPVRVKRDTSAAFPGARHFR